MHACCMGNPNPLHITSNTDKSLKRSLDTARSSYKTWKHMDIFQAVL